MIVADLIAHLQTLPPTARVLRVADHASPSYLEDVVPEQIKMREVRIYRTRPVLVDESGQGDDCMAIIFPFPP